MKTNIKKTFKGKEVKDFLSTFYVIETKQENGMYTLKSPIEQVTLSPITGFTTADGSVIKSKQDKHVLHTNFLNEDERTCIITSKYEPVLLSSLIKEIKDVVEENNMLDLIHTLTIKSNGQIVFDLENEESKMTQKSVKDFVVYKNVEEIYKELVLEGTDKLIHEVDFGKYRPSFMLTNSVDATKPVTLKMGIFRIVCSNGLIAYPEGYRDIQDSLTRVKHMKAKKIMESIREKLGLIPALYSNFDNSIINGQIEFDEIIKKDLHFWLNGYYSDIVDPIQNNKDYLSERTKETAKKGKELVSVIIDTSRNIMDFENLTSYLSKPEITSKWASGKKENKDADIKGLTDVVTKFIPEFRAITFKKLNAMTK